MKKTAVILLAVPLVTVFGVKILIGSKKERTKPPAESDKVAVRLKWLHGAQFAGFYVAEKKSFYKEVGIEVALNPGGIDFPAIQMVVEGKEQFGIVGAPQLLLAREKGIPVVALVAIFRKDPGVLISLAKSNIKKPQDLIGKKVGVELGTSVEQTYKSMMKNAGVDTLQIVEVPQKYDYTAFLAGKTNAVFYWAMGDLLLEDPERFNIIQPADYGVNFYADTLFTTEEMIKNNPDLVRRFIKATLRGWNFAYQNLEETIDDTLMYSDGKKEREGKYLQTSLEFLKPDDKPIGYMDKETWESMQKSLLEGGFMKKAVEIEKIYTTQFLD